MFDVIIKYSWTPIKQPPIKWSPILGSQQSKSHSLLPRGWLFNWDLTVVMAYGLWKQKQTKLKKSSGYERTDSLFFHHFQPHKSDEQTHKSKTSSFSLFKDNIL